MTACLSVQNAGPIDAHDTSEPVPLDSDGATRKSTL